MSTGIISGTVQVMVNLDGVSVSAVKQLLADNIATKAGVVAPVAKAGTISHQANRVLAVTGHGLAGTETLGVFWTDPASGLPKRHYGYSIASHTDNTITLSNDGAGDALPAALTVISVAVAQVVTDLSVKADDMVQMLAKADYAGLITWHDDSGVVVHVSDLTTEKLFDHWPAMVPGEAACFTDDVLSVSFYNASPTYTSKMYAIASVDPDLTA